MSRLVRAAALAALLVTAAGALPSGRADAQPAPYRRFRTLETPHFRVHVADGLEREGRVAGAAAERAYEMLSRELVRPRGMIDLVVSDDADYANGNATPFPGNRINIFAAPPIENAGLRFNDDWLEIVVTHELAHVFHLDRSRGIWRLGQRVFGRAPFLFPNLYGPAWLTEGIAVYYESRLTQGGRLKDAGFRQLALASAGEHQLPRLDQLSLSTPRFPGGTVAYAYGSLFLDHLSRTYGDSSVGRLVEEQSRQLIPFRLNHAARRSVGTSFTDAFSVWRDSLERTVGEAKPPLERWRELTTHGYYASAPRWRSDSTLVYVGTDGRETNAAWLLTTGGARTRLGRRNGLGANVPLADGSLLYSQLDFTGPSEVRSDLYRSSPDGSVKRLTRGARLIQPDARADGAIVAVQLAPARSRLVLLGADGAPWRVLREAAPDETWSEPRWSPDGRRIATVRRQHGGEFSLEVIDVASDSTSVLDRGRYVITSPSWHRNGAHIRYVSEEDGGPRLRGAIARGPARRTAEQPETGTFVRLVTAESSPFDNAFAGTALRADGYHVGVADIAQVPIADSPNVAPPPADTQPLAPGDYRRYSAWRSALPRYWYPVVEPASVRGTRLGATTSGSDALHRHLYSGYAAVSTSREGAVGALFYRYAGLRRPLLDVSVAQDWTSEGRVFDANGAIAGTLLKRTQDVSLAATFVRPRVRTYASLSAGLGLERRRFATDPVPLLSQLDTSFAREFRYPRAFVGAAWGNAQRPALSISPEDGISVAFTARERLRTDAASRTASLSVVGTSTGYKSLDLPGFAHHVLALRLAGGLADRKAATALEVGGTSGTTVDIVPGYTVGEGRRTFGVRGFPSGAVYGTRAATGSLEYRAPLALGGRGFGLLPFFFDRSSLTAFADAGVATCAANPLYASICSPAPLIGRTIASAGAELGISAAILEWDSPQAIRVGVAVPVMGRALTGTRPASVYVAFGLSY